MSQQDLRSVTRRHPFQPFRLFVSDGSAYEIRHPEMLMLGLRSVVIGLTTDPAQDLYEQFAWVDLVHITRIEPLGSAASPAKGDGARF
jgi:hypothetical protein